MIRTLILSLLVATSSSVVPAPAVADEAIEQLINELVTVSDPGFGYSGYFSGDEFLPYEGTGQIRTALLGATYRRPSIPMRKIVERGIDAVPVLLKHINDSRTIDTEPMSGMMWMEFSDEYDINHRTRREPPKGVNRESSPRNDDHPDEHALTVGDLCFVALGQIVNRNYVATRYQPTGGLIVNSPTYSKRLRDIVLADWSDLTEESHRDGLILDFKQPDWHSRRVNAYYRLSLYYPETVENVVMPLLSLPTYDSSLVYDFCKKVLYATEDRAECKRVLDEFTNKHGDVYREATREQLFGDLAGLESDEFHGFTPDPKSKDHRCRELLVTLFDQPENVLSNHRPESTVIDKFGLARLIESLTHDRVPAIGSAVRRIYQRNREDDDSYLTTACLKSLAHRGDAATMIDRLNQVRFDRLNSDGQDFDAVDAICTTSDPTVLTAIEGFAETTINDQYFTKMLAALERSGKRDPEWLWKRAIHILNGLPDATKQGQDLLELIGDRFPDRAENVYREFLAKGTTERAETMCVLLWSDHPLALKILAPLLDDERLMSGFSVPMRVCDRAATAISHRLKKPRFDSEWSLRVKDDLITRYKAECIRRSK
ncbi:hypothetical protein Poly51_21930 [Rubripirellula tenax]|uniref:HEAT repeat protein n=1 Tax=Rubripirellula tenax TaxID=2528015 RepID=A0A5C6FDB0_9BACT|nr:hypothetical protein [Rubripirellula tenax]TWU59405.1 hypothetical protein Poly51_21930 [Rubripirellula tenax]